MCASNIESNRAHYYGAVQLISQEEVFCKAVDEFPDTWENEFAVVRVRTDQLKGYYQRICEVVVNVTNPLDVRGEWSDIANHTGWIGHVL